MIVAIYSRILRTLPLLRLRPFDTGTVDGRVKERHRRITLSALTSVLAKIVSVSTALISVPLTLHYLGAERYGMWMTMSSLIAMLGFADLGMGNGVLTAVAHAYGNDDRDAIRRIVSSGLFVLTLIALVILIVFGMCYNFVPWYRIFNVNGSVARNEAAPALALFVLCFALAVPTGIVQRVQMGLQRGFMASLWQCAGSALGLGGVLIAIHLEAGLPWLVLALVGAPLFASLLNSFLFFGKMAPDIAPRRSAISRRAVHRIASAGVFFLVLQIATSITYSSDNLLIAQYLGAETVTQYAVPDKLFSLVPMIVLMFFFPLWPAYGEAIARGDAIWVRRTLRKSLKLAFLFSVSVCALLVAIAPWLIIHWVGRIVDPPLLLLSAFAMWRVIDSCAITIAMFLNGANLIRFQALIAIFFAIAALALKIYLVPRIGIAGILFSTSIAWLIFAGLPLYIYVRRSTYLSPALNRQDSQISRKISTDTTG